jgi:hypothetical protein
LEVQYGKYSCFETWNQLRVKVLKVDWYNIVWFPLAIPRHSFILWLAFKDGLTTKYRMSLWGYTGSMACLFCHGHIETKEHLFFSCSFSQRIWRVILTDCGVVEPPVSWNDVVNWFKGGTNNKSLKSTNLSFLAAVGLCCFCWFLFVVAVDVAAMLSRGLS